MTWLIRSEAMGLEPSRSQDRCTALSTPRRAVTAADITTDEQKGETTRTGSVPMNAPGS